MIKTYKSSTVLSFTVRLSNESLKRVRFTPYSWGGGIYITDNKLIQEAIEHEPLYGSLFKLQSVEETEEEKAKAVATPKAEPKKEEAVQEQPKEEEVKNNIVKVADFAEAKEYLMENFGYKSAQLRSQKAITEAAETHNITFEYA